MFKKTLVDHVPRAFQSSLISFIQSVIICCYKIAQEEICPLPQLRSVLNDLALVDTVSTEIRRGFGDYLRRSMKIMSTMLPPMNARMDAEN